MKLQDKKQYNGKSPGDLRGSPVMGLLKEVNPNKYVKAIFLSYRANRRERFNNRKEKAYNLGFNFGVNLAKGLEKVSLKPAA